MALFSDLATQMIPLLGSRTDLSTQAQNAVADAVGDLCSSFEFEELEVQGPNYNLVANQDSYAVDSSTWLNSGDAVQTIMDLMVYTDAAPTNNSASNPAPWVQIKFQDFKRQDQISPFPGSWPTLASRHKASSAGVPAILFRGVPNGTWTTFMRYRRMHPFTSTYPYSGTTLLLPFEWQYVIKQYGAAMVWNGYLKEHDRAQQVLLFLGLTRDERGNYIPGLIQRLMSKRQREYPQDTQSIDMPQQMYQGNCR